MLPKHWDGFSFLIRYRDSIISIKVTKSNVHLQLNSGNAVTCDIYDNTVLLEQDKEYTQALKN